LKRAINRRDLLQKLSFGIGATAIPFSSWAKDETGRVLRLPDPSKKKKFAKALTAVTLGAGNRGNVYGDYAIEYPEEISVVGVAEPIDIRRKRYSEKHNISIKNQFTTWEQVFDRPKFADAVIITTPDDLHYGPCMKALALGYDILLEKPISPSEQECRDILELSNKTGRIVAVCHVLRYAPYFMRLQELIETGMIGEIVSMQHFEPIEHVHMSHSFVRGNWHNSMQTAPIILAKSCHDLDIIKWMIGKPCKKIQAFGSLKWFHKGNAPEGSPNRCTDGCPAEETCPYSALKIYHRDRTWLHHFDLPEDKSKHGDAIIDYLRSSDYGRCVYRMDNDQPDHYTVNMLFEDDVTVSFNMEAFTSYHGRRTRVMGSMGDIVGDMYSYKWTDFRTGKVEEWDNKTDGHGGGDWNLMSDWIQAVAHQDESLLTSNIGASIESHIMGFAAERSRKSDTIEKITLQLE
jgi:predicted dehydrogenase